MILPRASRLRSFNTTADLWLARVGLSGLELAGLAFIVLSLIVVFLAPAAARDAAFMDPGNTNAGAAEEALKVEPKGDIDVGETQLNVAKRATLFFVNTTTAPIHIDKISLNNDGNVMADVSNDDCSKQANLTPQNRCSVEVSVTPTSPGPWNVEMLIAHNGAGRLARAKLSGKTTGATDQKKDNGLSLNSKDSGTVSFGDVDIDGSKVVRSALMTNDSPDPLTIYSIDVIEAENGLTRLDQGCAVDMELKPGESCPITLVWTPITHGQISTDMIIRHSGRTGFVVIPIRGTAKGSDKDDKDDKDAKDSKGGAGKGMASGTGTITHTDGRTSSVPMPPSATDLARAVKDIPAVDAEALVRPAAASGYGGAGTSKRTTKDLRLIGTVGNRAVLLKPDDTTTVASVGDDISLDDREVRLTGISSKTADILDGGKKKTLVLTVAQELVIKASANMKSTKEGDGETGGTTNPQGSNPQGSVNNGTNGNFGNPGGATPFALPPPSPTTTITSLPSTVPPPTPINGVTR